MKQTFLKLKHNNQGLTIIELLAVLGIMAVLFTFTAFSLSITPASEAKKVVANVDAMISRTKVGSLAKTGDVYMEVHIDSKGTVSLNYYEDDVMKETEVLTTRAVEIGYLTTTGSTETILGTNQSLVLAFDRRTTGFLTLTEAAALTAGSRGNPHTINAATGNTYCNKIYVRGGTVEYFIEIGPTTGSHYRNV